MTFEEIEGSESETESSGSEASPEPSESESTEAAAKPAVETKPEPTPFHEHERFKELVAQKNQALEGQKSLETKLAQLEAQFKATQTPAQKAEKDELIEDLRKIDPRLAARLEAHGKTNNTVEQLQARLEQFENNAKQQAQSQTVQNAVAKINQMHETNKVSPEVKQIINDQLDLLYMQGKLNLKNLEETYKVKYESIKKFEDALKRNITAEYSAGKKADAQAPTSQPKGTPAKPAAKPAKWSTNKETAKQQIVSRYEKAMAAQKQSS